MGLQPCAASSKKMVVFGAIVPNTTIFFFQLLDAISQSQPNARLVEFQGQLADEIVVQVNGVKSTLI